MMKKILSFAIVFLFIASVVWSAQTTVNTPEDSFETGWDRQQEMNTELYADKHVAVTLSVDVDDILSITGQLIGFDTQTANTVFAGPVAGGDAIPTFRVLVAGDIPDLSATYLLTQTVGIANDNLLEVDGSPNSAEYARFTANGLEGRTEAEFKGDFNIEDADINALIATAFASPSAIGSTTPAAGTFTTLSAGAGGFSVDADGDATAKSVNFTKTSGVAGATGWYEANSTDTNVIGIMGAENITESWYGQFPDPQPAGQVPVYGTPAGTGGPDSSKVSAMTWHTISEPVGWTIYEDDADTAVADGKKFFAVPAYMSGWELVDVVASVADLNSAASGATTVVIRRVRGATAVDMTSTGVTVGFSEYTASDETVDTANDELATGDKIFVDVNAVTTAVQKGLSVTAIFEKR